MIDRQALLSDLQTLLKRLEADLLERSESAEIPAVGDALRLDYEQARAAERTAQNFEDWRSDYLTQAAAAWVLSCVFVRFLEDNRLIDPPRLAGPGERLQQARDEQELYFGQHATETDREYLLAAFRQLATLPGTRDVFGEHNPVWELPNWLSGDAAGELLRFFQRIEADTGHLNHDFTDPDWDTRFLGDLYQNLSEAARKRYALLQTPEFVEEFILDRTLEPALDEFGLVVRGQSSGVSQGTDDRQLTTDHCFKMIDPACGSGHFLLGAFPRILGRWQRQEPGGKVRDLVQKTLDSITGVDVNPYAVAIARFRLLLVAMQACGIQRLAEAPGFRINLVCGDTLLHAPLSGGQNVFDWEKLAEEVDCEHAYNGEDLETLKRVLRLGAYHAVVANPPYITPKDARLNQRYRTRFTSCHRQYSLGVPFLEMLFRLAVAGGFTGQITANSFMKREFGKKLIEQFLPRIDLTHVIDTSGAYIPGHGTPTVILFGRHRSPVASTIRTVMGIRGEPATPDDPAQGLVWSAILDQLDRPGSQSEFVSVADSSRDLFHQHPWSIGGGGAAELKERIDERSETILGELVEEVGASVVTREDEVFQIGKAAAQRRMVRKSQIRPMIDGEHTRDWGFEGYPSGLFPYDPETFEPVLPDTNNHLLWLHRTGLAERVAFGKTQLEHGKEWFEYSMLFKDRLRGFYRIAQAEVATHNHFVLDRGGKVFKQTAPVIKLPPEASEDEHLGLLGLLNSSTACFWLKQVCFPKGGDHVGQEGARVRRSLWDERYAFNATNLQAFPLPAGRPLELARRLDRLSGELQATLPREILTQMHQDAKEESLGGFAPLRETLSAAQDRYDQIRWQMVALQENLDWECYRLYGLIDEALAENAADIPVQPGQRAFEIVLARKMAAGAAQSTWFERHGSIPITTLPDSWPEEYRRLVERRIEVIETNPQIALIEQPEYKRRWSWESWEAQHGQALREWLLDRLESYFDFDGRMSEDSQPTAKLEIALTSVAKLADMARQDAEFLAVGEVYRNDAAFDVQRLVEDLVKSEHIPLLPALRYKPSGLRKRQEWEQTWELQRQEDRLNEQLSALSRQLQQATAEAEKQQLRARQEQLAGELAELTASIAVPPKYASADFISTGGARYWSLRGKLDVPKERWVSFPHCEGPDGTLVIAWAGYDHLQLARAISAWYVEIKENLGGHDDPRLVPLLACLIELLPWLQQWHHDLDPEYNQRMDEVFEGFLTEEAKTLGLTLDEIEAWEPPKKAGGRRRRSGT